MGVPNWPLRVGAAHRTLSANPAPTRKASCEGEAFLDFYLRKLIVRACDQTRLRHDEARHPVGIGVDGWCIHLLTRLLDFRLGSL